MLPAEAVAETSEGVARLAALPPAERTAAVVNAYAGCLHQAGVVEAERQQLIVEQWPELLTPGPTGTVTPHGPVAAGLVTGMTSRDLAHLSCGALERTAISGGGVAGVLAPGDRWLPLIDAVDPRVAADEATRPFRVARDGPDAGRRDGRPHGPCDGHRRPAAAEGLAWLWALVTRLTSAWAPRDLWLSRAAAQARVRAATVEQDSPRRSDPRYDPPAPAPHRWHRPLM